MNVAAIRNALGLTQWKLAELVGVHAMTVSKWERGVLSPNAHQCSILESLGAARRRRAAQVPGPARELAGLLNLAFIDVTEVSGMKLSASNQLKGKIVALEEGPITARVVIEIAPKVRIVSVITSDSVRRLGLRAGKTAVAIIKATEVIVATP